MSHVQSYVPSESMSGVSMISGHSGSQYNPRNGEENQAHYFPNKSKSAEKYRAFVQNTDHKLQANVERMRMERLGLPQQGNKLD